MPYHIFSQQLIENGFLLPANKKSQFIILCDLDQNNLMLKSHWRQGPELSLHTCPWGHGAQQGKQLCKPEKQPTAERDFKIVQVSELLFPFGHPSPLLASFKCNVKCFILITTEWLCGSKDENLHAPILIPNVDQETQLLF